MKKLILFLILLVSIAYSQPLRLGIKADILTGNKYLNYEIGPDIELNYFLKKLPVSINACTRFYLGELSNENNFSFGHTLTVTSLGISLNYYPLTWPIEPYVGAGVFYNIINLMSSGNPVFIDGTTRGPINVKNSLSEEITLGLNFSANTPINFVVEVTKTFNQPEYTLYISDSRLGSYSNTYKKEHLNFNSLFLKLGLYFKL